MTHCPGCLSQQQLGPTTGDDCPGVAGREALREALAFIDNTVRSWLVREHYGHCDPVSCQHSYDEAAKFDAVEAQVAAIQRALLAAERK